MKNKVFYNLICVILVVSLCFSYFALSASAAHDVKDNQVEFYCSEPAKDSNNGYAIFFFQTSSGNKWARLVSWNLSPRALPADDTSVQSVGSVEISIGASTITFTPRSTSGLGTFSFMEIYSNTYEIESVKYGNLSSLENFSIQSNGEKLLGYVIYGNGYVTTNYYPFANDVFDVLFSADAVEYNQLLQLLAFSQQLGIKIDDVNANLNDVTAWLTDLYNVVADDVLYLLDNIEITTGDIRRYLLQCKDLLVEIRDALGASGPSFEETMGDNFGNDLNDYNTNDAFGSLPHQAEGDKGKIYGGIGFFTLIYDGLFYRMPELKHAIIFILTISFVGYVLGRKLNKE